MTGDIARTRIAVPARSARSASDTADTATRTTAYRGDLDGLRGVAIALVVVFHIWFGRVSGGVDVFLVLSGFFFTGLLVRRAERGAVGRGLDDDAILPPPLRHALA